MKNTIQKRIQKCFGASTHRFGACNLNKAHKLDINVKTRQSVTKIYWLYKIALSLNKIYKHTFHFSLQINNSLYVVIKYFNKLKEW